jgi:hypothetical protein
MNWNEIKKKYPKQWLLIEALEANMTPEQRRHLDRISVLERCSDGSTAFKSYREIHTKFPDREYYYVHTSRDELDIIEETRLGAMFKNILF